MQKKKAGPPPAVPEHIVQKRIREAQKRMSDEATTLCVSIMLMVLLDKFGMEDQIQDVYKYWCKFAEAVQDGEIKMHEIRNVLNSEYNIHI